MGVAAKFETSESGCHSTLSGMNVGIQPLSGETGAGSASHSDKEKLFHIFLRFRQTSITNRMLHDEGKLSNSKNQTIMFRVYEKENSNAHLIPQGTIKTWG